MKNLAVIKLVHAVLLIICLLPMEYGYFMIVRFVSMILFSYYAYLEREKGGSKLWLFIALALLFQPFYKISLGRTLWNVVDVAIAGLLVSDILKNK